MDSKQHATRPQAVTSEGERIPTVPVRNQEMLAHGNVPTGKQIISCTEAASTEALIGTCNRKGKAAQNREMKIGSFQGIWLGAHFKTSFLSCWL